MLCKPTKVLIDSPDYIVERKYDGIRVQLSVDSTRHYIETRTGQDITHRFPEIQPKIVHQAYILDGEICHFGDNDVTDFQALQARVQRNADVDYYASLYPATLVVFDCLMIDCIGNLHQSLLERKAHLEYFTTDRIIKAPYREAYTLTEADVPHWEGLIYKRKLSQYEPGKRTSDWMKYKFVKREKVWVVGFTHGMGRRSNSFGALIVARLIDGVYCYAGTVGTGYTDMDLEILMDMFKFVDPNKERDLMCRQLCHVNVIPFQVEVEYLELTKSGIMRQPSFKEYVD